MRNYMFNKKIAYRTRDIYGMQSVSGACTNEQFCTAARDAMIRTKECRREIKFSRPAHADVLCEKLIKSHIRNLDAYE